MTDTGNSPAAAGPVLPSPVLPSPVLPSPVLPSTNPPSTGPLSTVPELVATAAARAPATVALSRGAETCTYEQLVDRMTATARGIAAAGVSPGDVVGVWGARTVGT